MQKKDKAIDKALRSLAMRAHSEKEIVDKLTRAGYDEHDIAEAMASLTEYDLINDVAFAEQWAASRAKRGLGQWRIARELREKGIDREAVDAALSHIEDETVFETAQDLAEKYLRRGGESAPRRAYAALIRRGYGYDVAKQALSLAKTAIEDEDT